jgi:hypothetical protein
MRAVRLTLTNTGIERGMTSESIRKLKTSRSDGNSSKTLRNYENVRMYRAQGTFRHAS